jgi:Mlc titration factor MtfA (ptsG expression regulator)
MEILEWIYRAFLRVTEEIRFRLFYGPIFHRFLNYRYHFYRRLPRSQKMQFLRLVRDHYEYFEFVQRDVKVTRAMKAIICCGASQLVMNLPAESLTYFTRIIIYPDYYNSRITHKRHKGEVNPGFRLIVFSWRGIMEGLNRDDDGLNLLLHEFAHALWLEHKLMSDQYTVLDPHLIEKFESLAHQEMDQLHENENHLFRKYAFSNIEEFFAVAVENFFERPGELNQQLPHFYHLLSKLFIQDPVKYLPAAA